MSVNVSFCDSLSNFAFSLYNVTEKSDNVCMSPVSITATILLLMMGTKGTSRKQLQRALFNNTHLDDNVNINYKMLQKNLMSEATGIEGMQLSMANHIYIGKQHVHRIIRKFRRQARNDYKCSVRLMDFGREPRTKNIINKLIELSTGHKIKNFLKDGILSGDTFMVLSNLVYFKGPWKYKFEAKLTKNRTFWINKSTNTTVSMMYRKFVVKATEDKELNCRAVELPYKGDNMSMTVILSNEVDGLVSLEKKLSITQINRLTKKMFNRETEVSLPKFKIKGNINMKQVLQNLGAYDIFNPIKADFSKMVRPYDQREELYVDKAIHECVLEVNEEGSEAKASTSLFLLLRSASPPPAFKFTADHPFLFLIRDKVGAVLFLGRYGNPDMKETGNPSVKIPFQAMAPITENTTKITSHVGESSYTQIVRHVTQNKLSHVIHESSHKTNTATHVYHHVTNRVVTAVDKSSYGPNKATQMDSQAPEKNTRIAPLVGKSSYETSKATQSDRQVSENKSKILPSIDESLYETSKAKQSDRQVSENKTKKASLVDEPSNGKYKPTQMDRQVSDNKNTKALVEESSYGKNKDTQSDRQVSDDKTMKAPVEESSYGKNKATQSDRQVSDDKTTKALVDESSYRNNKATQSDRQVSESETTIRPSAFESSYGTNKAKTQTNTLYSFLGLLQYLPEYTTYDTVTKPCECNGME